MVKNRLLRVILISGFVLVGAFLLLEISLRLFPEIRPSYAQTRIDTLFRIDMSVEPFWVDDPELGYRVQPFRDDAIDTIDFSYRRQTDKFGFSNAEWPDRADVAVIGDSLLSGVGVGIEGQVTSVIENQLPGTTVVNVNLSGASPQHLLRMYRTYAAELQPKVVVAILYVASDIDNTKHFDVWNRVGTHWGYNEFRAHHYLDALEELTGSRKQASVQRTSSSSSSGPRQIIRRLINASVVGKELLYVTDPMRKGVLHKVTFPDGSVIHLYERFQNRLRAGIGTDYPPIQEIFFGPLAELRDAVANDGARLVLGLIPSKEELFVHPSETGHLRLLEEVRAGLDGLDIEILDLYPAVEESANETAPFFPHDIHFSAAGNEAVGVAIADWLVESGALESPGD